MKIYNN